MGFRPSKGIVSMSREKLNEEISALDAHFFRLESTPQGRKMLRDAGWQVAD